MYSISVQDCAEKNAASCAAQNTAADIASCAAESPAARAGQDGPRFLQTPFWAEFKSRHGWRALRLRITAAEDGRPAVPLAVSVLVRPLGRGPLRFSVAYLPMFPELPEKDAPSAGRPQEYADFLTELADALKDSLPPDTLCVRYDPPVEFDTCGDRDSFVRSLEALPSARRTRLRKAGADIQPPDTVVVDLRQSEDEILAAMKPKWRYNIRLSERRGVRVRKIGADDPDFRKYFDGFYSLFRTTAARDGIAIHAKQYYADLLEAGAAARQSDPDAPVVTLYMAEHEGDLLAGIITLFSRREAVYLYGASGNVRRNLMPAYLLQWTAIRDAKAFGSECYDLYGTPPDGDERHPMHGLYLFKTGFGGHLIHRTGAVDVPLRPAAYRLYTALEKARAFWHKRVVKKIIGRA